jgi:hypothetical protein
MKVIYVMCCNLLVQPGAQKSVFPTMIAVSSRMRKTFFLCLFALLISIYLTHRAFFHNYNHNSNVLTTKSETSTELSRAAMQMLNPHVQLDNVVGNVVEEDTIFFHDEEPVVTNKPKKASYPQDVSLGRLGPYKSRDYDYKERLFEAIEAGRPGNKRQKLPSLSRTRNVAKPLVTATAGPNSVQQSVVKIDRSFEISKKFCDVVPVREEEVRFDEASCAIAQRYVSQSGADFAPVSNSIAKAVDIVSAHAKSCLSGLRVVALDVESAANNGDLSFIHALNFVQKTGGDEKSVATSVIDASSGLQDANIFFKEKVVHSFNDFQNFDLSQYYDKPVSLFFFGARNLSTASIMGFFSKSSFSVYLIGARQIYSLAEANSVCKTGTLDVLFAQNERTSSYAYVAFSKQNTAHQQLLSNFAHVARNIHKPYPKLYASHYFSHSSSCFITKSIEIQSLHDVSQSVGWEIVTSSDDRAFYLSFLPTMAKWWKKNGLTVNLAFVTRRTENDPVIQELKKYANVHLFSPVAGVPEENQGKLARSFLTTVLEAEKVYTIADLDLYLLRPNYLQDSLKCVPYDSLLAIGENLYHEGFRANKASQKITKSAGTTKGKFPIYYTSATGSTFQEVINPTGKSWKEFPKSLTSSTFDGLENALHSRRGFSDESLLRKLLFDWS